MLQFRGSKLLTQWRAASLWNRIHRKFWRLGVLFARTWAVGLRQRLRSCLFQQPVKNTCDRGVFIFGLSGRQWRGQCARVGARSDCLYIAPAQSHHCLPANDVQLVAVSEFRKRDRNSHVSVDGVLFQAGSGRQHTPFVMNVTTILPISAVTERQGSTLVLSRIGLQLKRAPETNQGVNIMKNTTLSDCYRAVKEPGGS